MRCPSAQIASYPFFQIHQSAASFQQHWSLKLGRDWRRHLPGAWGGGEASRTRRSVTGEKSSLAQFSRAARGYMNSRMGSSSASGNQPYGMAVAEVDPRRGDDEMLAARTGFSTGFLRSVLKAERARAASILTRLGLTPSTARRDPGPRKQQSRRKVRGRRYRHGDRH
jgi:hypothetical protein